MGTRGEMVDEAMNDELRRENADERHVVGEAERGMLSALPDEALHGSRVEDAVALQLGRSEKIIDVPA